jgi:hypothetical protein
MAHWKSNAGRTPIELKRQGAITPSNSLCAEMARERELSPLPSTTIAAHVATVWLGSEGHLGGPSRQQRLLRCSIHRLVPHGLYRVVGDLDVARPCTLDFAQIKAQSTGWHQIVNRFLPRLRSHGGKASAPGGVGSEIALQFTLEADKGVTVGIGLRDLQAAISQPECAIDVKGRAQSASRSKVCLGSPGVLGTVEVVRAA